MGPQLFVCFSLVYSNSFVIIEEFVPLLVRLARNQPRCTKRIVQDAVDVCNFDSSWSGGATEWRRVAGIAHAFDVRMAHHEEPQIAAHLLASIPHGTFVECFHPDRDPIWWNLVANRPKLVDGSLQLSDAPGLGWELDQEYLDAHRVPR